MKARWSAKGGTLLTYAAMLVICLGLPSCGNHSAPAKPIVEPQAGKILPRPEPGAFISMTGYCYDPRADYAYKSSYCAAGDMVISRDAYARHIQAKSVSS